MPFATRHRDDHMPQLEALSGFNVRVESRPELMARLQRRSVEDISRRFADGHKAYVAYVNEEPAAFGWVATRTAHIGELNASIQLPSDERYLWNFVTLEAFRGRGIYPRLLQAIVREESVTATRFWIAYAPENHASGTGIRKAGFTTLAELSFDMSGRPALKSMIADGAETLRTILPFRATSESLTPCWKCVRAGRPPMGCAEGSCACDYQKPERACA